MLERFPFYCGRGTLHFNSMPGLVECSVCVFIFIFFIYLFLLKLGYVAYSRALFRKAFS